MCMAWGGRGTLAKQTGSLVALPVQPELVSVAATFVDLQEARHVADYDLSRNLTKIEARKYVNDVQTAYVDWAAVRHTSNAAIFLAALLYEKHWKAR